MAQTPAQSATPKKTTDPDELVLRATAQHGLPAAELLHEAALLYRQAGATVSAMHSLEHGLQELEELIESPPAARLGAALEFELGRACEEELGRFEEALVHYQRAFKLRPDYLEPLRRGRLIYQSLGDMDMVARLSELHLANLVAGDAQTGVALALELGQLKLKLSDPAGAVEVLRTALRLHNDSSDEAEVPETLLSTLADAYVSPEFQPGAAEKEQARRNASDIYLGLAKRYLDAALVKLLDRAQNAEEEDGDAGATAGAIEALVPEGREPQELTETDKKAVHYLKKALDADVRNVTAAGLLETMYLRVPEPGRSVELVKLYKSGARVTRRGPKLLALYETTGTIDFIAVIDACRAGLDAVSSVDEWRETRQTLHDMLQKSGDLLGLAALKEEEAVEAALPEERAELIMQAAEFYQRGGDQERYIACLKQAFHELPLHTEAFRKLSDFYKSRRDFIGLAVIQENRMAAQFETARLDLQSYTKQLEELAELYEKKLQDVVSAAAIWRRIDELLQSVRSQSERKRLGQRLTRIDMQVSELQLELERTAMDDPGRIELLRRLAQLYRELHEPKHAATVYEELLQLAPTDLPSLKILIELREQNSDVPGQLELLRQQVSIATDRAERLALLRRMMALCEQRMLQRDERWDGQAGIEMTIWVCKSLLAELPSDRDALRRLSDALQLAGNKTDLLDVLESYLKVAPTPREKLALHRRIARIAEDHDDLARAVSHLERAVRICPPGPESEEVLSELARIYGRQGRMELAVQTLELCLKQNPRASVELYRILGRLTLAAAEPALLEKSVRAFREVLIRLPDDLEALSALQRLHRSRQEWPELELVLRRLLRAPDPPLPPRERLSIAMELAEVLGQHLGDVKQAASLLEQVQAESPVVDLRVHRHLRGLYEEMGDYQRAARYAERELLLTEDPVARLERAVEIAQMWRTRAKDLGRALLSYERVERIAPVLPAGTPEGDAVRRLVVHALEAMSQMFAQSDDWQQVVMIGQRRLNVAVEQGEAMQAAAILVELAQVYEERLDQAPEGFTLRVQAFELAPHLVSIEQLTEVAEKYGQWRPLCDLHVVRVERALQEGAELPIDSVLAASQIYEQRLGDPQAAFRLLRRAMPLSVTGAIAATTAGDGAAQILGEMNRLVRALGKSARSGGDAAELSLDSAAVVRDLISVYRGLVDELCRQKDAGTEDTAVRLHRLLGDAARLREDLLGDAAGALADRIHAFTVGGERDHSRDPAAAAVFRETLDELHRLALVAGQIKEAATIDSRRLDRADDDLRRQQVACEGAAWLDDHGGDPQRALRACLKALPLCTDGSDAQAETRGRLFRLGQKLGLLAWDEIARAERALVSGNPRGLRQRLLYLASMWQLGAGDHVRAIDAAGQAYRLTYFPAGLPNSNKGGPPLSDLVVHNIDEALADEQRLLRGELDRLAQTAPTDGEGAAKLVALLDNLATQLHEANAGALAAQVALDAGQLDERRGRLGQAERRYQEALKQPATTELAMQYLERVYRQQRRLSDLAALLEKRRPLVPESQQRQVLLDLAEVYREINKLGPALTALGQAIAIDDSDATPYLLMARIYEAQRTHLRAVECYKNAAQRSPSAVEAAKALQQAAELLEKKLDEAGEALDCLLTATRRILAAQVAVVEAGQDQPTLAEAQPELVEAREAAWAGVERLLTTQHRLAELGPLLAERIAATPVAAVEERAQLLSRQLQLLQQRRKLRSDATPQPGIDPLQVSSDLLTQVLSTLNALLSLRPDDDDLRAQQEELLIETGQLPAARDVALARAEAAAQSADVATQAQRWLAVFKRELEVDNLAGAEQALERALALHPDSTASLHSLVALHQRTNNPAGQIAALCRLASHETELDEAVAALRQAAQLTQDALGDSEGARRLLLTALERVETAAAVPEQTEAQHAATQRALCAVLLPLFDLAQKDGDTVGTMSYGRRAIETGAVPAARAAELHNVLGQAALAAGSTFDAIHHFESALRTEPGQLPPTRALIELLYPAGEFGRIDALIAQTLAVADAGELTLQDNERAGLLRRQAEAREALGQEREAYEALLAAEQLAPGDLEQTLWLGDSAFALGEYEVAARALGTLLAYAGDPAALPPPLTTATLADALDRAAVANQALGDLAMARQLWQAALTVVPEHPVAADHYLELLLAGTDTQDATAAMGLLSGRAERALQAGDLPLGLGEYLRAADLAAGKLGDASKAHELLLASLAQLPAVTPPELVATRRSLESRLADSAERLGDLAAAKTYAQGLAASAETAGEQARWLHRAAVWALSAQSVEEGKALLRQALQVSRHDVAMIEELVVLLTGAEVAETLPGVLTAAAATGLMDGPAAERLLSLWQQVAQAQLGQGQAMAAASSYDRAIAMSGPGETERELRLRRAALEALPETEVERVRAHLLVLLRHDPVDKDLLGRLKRIEEHADHRGATWRLQQLLHLLDGALPAAAAPVPLPAGTRLDESEHARWADPEARVLAEVMTVLWDGIYGLKAPTLDSFGVVGTDRLQPSESSADELARTFAAACRVLGNQRAGLYRAAAQQHVLPRVFARMPTALIVSPALVKRPHGELQFILARGVEGLRPEYILATAMPPAELSKLVGLAVRAFHPRHAAKPADDVSVWKRDLAYRAVKRLTELLRDHPDVTFSTVSWRRAVRRTLQRAALLFAGDLVAAVNVIRGVDLQATSGTAESGHYLRLDHHGADPHAEAEADVRDLCAFFIDPQFAALFDRLHPR